ncbi:hypothetical protein ACN28S_42045 [Cystobacter fuscus]
MKAAPSSTDASFRPMRRSREAACSESLGPRSTSRCPRKLVDCPAESTPSEHSSKSSRSVGAGPGTKRDGLGRESSDNSVSASSRESETRVR